MIEERQNIYKTLKLEQPEFFKVVSDLMFKHDPMKINLETHTDEYDPEAGTVISRLETATNQDDVATILHEEFIAWFGEGIAGDRDSYIALAQDIWQAWCAKA